MKTSKIFKAIALALGCAALAITTIPSKADRSDDRGHRAHFIKAHAGTTFTLVPVEFDANGNPTKFSHTVDGVVRVSLLGNCTFHGDVPAIPRPDGSFSLAGTGRITSADGATSLDIEVEGFVAPDPANPAFGNFHYDAKFTGGTGRMENARGKADIDGFGMFTSPSEGKATWVLRGHVVTRSHGHDE